MRSLLIAATASLVALNALDAQTSQRPAPTPFTITDALDVVSTSIGDLTRDGRWVAVTEQTRREGLAVDFRRDGDPSYIRPGAGRTLIVDTQTGAARPIFADKRVVRGMAWSPDGARLAMLVVRGDAFEPVIWDRATGALTTVRPAPGTYVAENSDVRWTHDGKSVAFAVRTSDWRAKVGAQFERQTKGPIFVQSTKDPFLAWDELRRLGSVRSVVAYDLATKRIRELVPTAMISNYNITEDDSVITYNEDITRKTDYDVIGGSENKLMARSLSGGDARTVLPTLKGMSLVWAKDGHHYAFGKDGRVYVASIEAAGAPRQVAGPAESRGPRADTAAADTSKEARDRRERERFSPVRFSAKGDLLLASNKDGYWVVDVASGTKDLVLATGDSTTGVPRYGVAGWSNDGRYVYLTVASRIKWERGLVRVDRTSKQVEELIRDGRLYSGFRLSDDGKVALVSVAEGNRPGDLYAGDARLASLHRLTDANPQLRERRLGKTELLSYLDADGHSKYAVVYYPADYQAGTRYPTVFNVYEDFFDDTFDATVNVLTANGYVVVKPSVDFDIGYPGEAWVKGVTAAANKLIEMGVTDGERMGVHGTSYGGYATNLLITQTNRFKAAINISGKVDLVSFYTDSPRLGVRNVHAAEKSQDRIGATLWQQPQKYVAHSAIFFADRIQTPLLLLTGAQDSNVPADNTREMYYALRRLGKECVWVNYMNGGHGAGNASVDEFVDMHKRILEWYDSHLKPRGAALSAER